MMLFCHDLNERIAKYLNDTSFLRPEQAAFRKVTEPPIIYLFLRQ